MKRDTISRFNRDTVWLATGVLGAVVFAALVLVVQEYQPNATQADRDLLPNANPARVSSVIAKSSNVNGEMTPRAGTALIPSSLKLLYRKILPHRGNPQLRLQLPFSR